MLQTMPCALRTACHSLPGELAALVRMQRTLLHHVDTRDVVETFKCFRDPDSRKWPIPDHFKDSLVVIDEIHGFYVKSRAPLAEPIENFRALLGQNGGDAVIMTQWINCLHDAIKARIEHKTVFQKLTALGLKRWYLARISMPLRR